MALSDSVEYWNDINNAMDSSYVPFTHLKGKDCKHYHKYETESIGDVGIILIVNTQKTFKNNMKST
jgi:hypothetical protein